MRLSSGARTSRAALVLVLLAVAAANLLANTRLHDPPRFDGAAYAMLGRAVLNGEGYREIAHPEALRHAHFPPGYPIALAALWWFTGPSETAAHAFSIVCALGAVVAFWRWFGWLYPSSTATATAWPLALALAVNWRWGREGGAILSEPLFLLESGLVVLLAERTARRPREWRAAVLLGLAAGASILTRHVGIGLLAAVVLHLLLRGRRREALVALLVAALMVVPWVGWIVLARRPSQIGLVPGNGLASLIGAQALFYLRRIPDQLVGPVVEVGTVFRPAFSPWATACAILASGVIVLGWARLLRSPRRRLAGLIPLTTLPILLAWPFTEAGRFLVPLVPILVLGAMEGLAGLLGAVRPRDARRLAALLVLAASVPYSVYGALARSADRDAQRHAPLDRACRWVRDRAEGPGVVLTTSPAEVFWQTGRRAVTPAADDAGIARQLDDAGIALVIVAEDRYARAPASPLARFLARHPERLRRVGPGVYRTRRDGP